MGGTAIDLLRDPLVAVRGLFSNSRSAANPLESHAAGTNPHESHTDWGVKSTFNTFLYEQGAIDQVPHISDFPFDSIPSGSLVRFRGMVQDMFDVEYYIGAYKEGGIWHTNKYTDNPVGQEIEHLSPEIWDRRLFYCVPVPGENRWIQAAKFACISGGSDQRLKRQREATEVEKMDCDVAENGFEDQSKRMRADPENGNQDCTINFTDCRPSSCIIKIYDGCDGELKLNEIAEFVGVLSRCPDLYMEDDNATQLPANNVPRLHCITMRKISAYTVPRQLSSFDVLSARESLVLKLQAVVGEDRLAGEYLLLHMLSKVHSRVGAVAVGKLSLNFTGVCSAVQEGSLSPFASAIGQTISMLLPCSHAVPLSLENLNSSLFAPRKDYETNRLVSGALQLAAGTHLTLDETALNTGKLNETGVKNLQSLKILLESQKVEYDFKYYQMEMPTDIPVLVVSNAKSRLLPADALVPLKPSTGVVNLCAEEIELSIWRFYLNKFREAEHVIEPSMQKILEDDLVAARQKDRAIGPDTFHRWLTMARLLSLSYGERVLTRERWERVKNMESSCAARLHS